MISPSKIAEPTTQQTVQWPTYIPLLETIQFVNLLFVHIFHTTSIREDVSKTVSVKKKSIPRGWA